MVLLGVTQDLEPYSQWKFLRARVFEIVLQNQQAPGDGKGQGSLAGYSPWGHKESGMTEWLNSTKSQGKLLDFLSSTSE